MSDASRPAGGAVQGRGDRVIVSWRRIPAPRERVFEACVDPAILARWWGPSGFRNEFPVFDPRPGGRWVLVMHAPDGARYEMEKRFEAIVPGERIVVRHLDPVHGHDLEMTFAEEAGGTRLTWRMEFDHAEEAARVREVITAANEQNFDRLAGVLGAEPSGRAEDQG